MGWRWDCRLSLGGRGSAHKSPSDSRWDADDHLGWECPWKVWKHQVRPPLCCPLQQSPPPETHQTGFLQPARWASHICPGLSLAEPLGYREKRSANANPYALVDHTRWSEKRQAWRRERSLGSDRSTLGKRSHTYLGSWLCWQSMAHTSFFSCCPFYLTLAKEISASRWEWQFAQTRRDQQRETFLGVPKTVGCQTTLLA